MPRQAGQKGFPMATANPQSNLSTSCTKSKELKLSFRDFDEYSLILPVNACSLYPLAYAALATDKALALLSNGPLKPQNQPDCFFTSGITSGI